MENEYIDKWQSQIKKGTLSFIVLLVISEDEMYGYELIEKIKSQTGISIAEGTLYPLMNRLKIENLLESKWVEQPTGIPRKYYFLTTFGKRTLKGMKIQWINLQSSVNKLI